MSVKSNVALTELSVPEEFRFEGWPAEQTVKEEFQLNGWPADPLVMVGRRFRMTWVGEDDRCFLFGTIQAVEMSDNCLDLYVSAPCFQGQSLSCLRFDGKWQPILGKIPVNGRKVNTCHYQVYVLD